MSNAELKSLSVLANDIAEKSELLGQRRALQNVMIFLRDEANELKSDVDRYADLGVRDSQAMAIALAKATAIERIVDHVSKLVAVVDQEERRAS